MAVYKSSFTGPQIDAAITAVPNKVDKVNGKGLSTNDYTTAEKNKLAGIAAGATAVTVDSTLSDSSTNPVQNKVIAAALNSLSGVAPEDVAKSIVAQFQYQNIGIKRSSNTEVDIIIIAGQSNSVGRAQLSDAANHRGYLFNVPLEISWTYQTTRSAYSATHQPIIEPLAANSSGGYGYVPAFVRAYYEATGRKTCLVCSSEGGTSLNKWLHYSYDSSGNLRPNVPGPLYTPLVTNIEFAKTQLVTDGFTVGHIILLWLQGENEATYYGTDSQYCMPPEKLLTTFEEKRDFYKSLFISWIENLQTVVGLQKACIIRIGQRNTNDYFYGCIIEAETELGQEHEDICLVSTCLAGERIWKYPGTTETVNLMRDNYHYSIEGYIYAGIEAGLNMGIYVNSQFKTKPILYEYNTEYKKFLHMTTPSSLDYTLDDYLYLPMPHSLAGFEKYALRNTTSISLSPSIFTGDVNATQQLTVNYVPSNATNKGVTFSSSNTNVATVDSNGVVTLLASGSAVVTATLIADNTITAEALITCSAEILPESITLNEIEKQIIIGESFQLSATVLPANAANKNVIWTSNNPSAATVSSTGLVTALDLGTVTITCTSAALSSVYATCEVTMNATSVPLLDINFTEHDTAYYISQGLVSLPSSTTDGGATYDADGIHLTDDSFEAGLTLNTPIANSGDLEVILVCKIPPYSTSGSTAPFVKYGNVAILASDEGTPASNMLSPCLLFTTASESAQTKVQWRPTNTSGNSATLNSNFYFDNNFHTYRFTFTSPTVETSRLTLTIDNGAVITSNSTLARSGNFKSIFGITRDYSSSANFHWQAGQVIKSIQINRL